MNDVFSASGDGRSWAGRLRLSRCALAGEFVAELGPRRFAHAGPPVDPDDVAAGLLGAITAGLALEGENLEPAAVRQLIARGEVTLVSGHEIGAIGPLTGVITPCTPVWVVESDHGARAISPVHEGPDAAMRSGQFTEAVVARLQWFASTFAPVVDHALESLGGIGPVSVLSSGVNRGDEAHNRNVANSAELLRCLAPAIARRGATGAVVADVLDELAANVQGFLPVGMATAKIMVDEVQRSGPAGLVTAAGANGREFGIRVSGCPDWFTTASAVQRIASPFAGRSQADADLLVGDSLVMELIGLGVSALTAAPKLARALGADSVEAKKLVARARAISRSPSDQFQNPNDTFRGTPAGIQVAAVVESGIPPTFTVGYLSREVGSGRVGAGFYRPEVAVFEQADSWLRAAAGSADSTERKDLV